VKVNFDFELVAALICAISLCAIFKIVFNVGYPWLWQGEWDGLIIIHPSCILSSPVLAIAISPTLTAEMLLSSEGSALVTPAAHISTFSVEKNHHNAPPVIVH